MQADDHLPDWWIDSLAARSGEKHRAQLILNDPPARLIKNAASQAFF
jgi:hypothetical protein